MTNGSGRTVFPNIGVWYDEEAGEICLSVGGHGLSTVDRSVVSARNNPYLFNKLAHALRDEGKPHPFIVEDRQHK